MANVAATVGDNGVAGTVSVAGLVDAIADQTGTLAAANFSIEGLAADGEGVAVRHSVARTSSGFGNSVAASEVYSVTQGLRFAYPGVEADSPAVTRTDLVVD
jgi:hypothetical protein